MSVGPLIVAVGLALLARIDQSVNYLIQVLPAVFFFGLGLAITVAPLTATVLGSAPASRAGLASAINNTVARAGSLLAVAIIPALAGITGASYLHPSQFEDGFRRAAIISAVVCAFGGILAAMLIRNPSRPAHVPRVRLREEFSCPLDAPPLREQAAEEEAAAVV
jgi:MFS family permease